MKNIYVFVLMLIGGLFVTNTQAMYLDDEDDLVYYGYRYYSPSHGRWLSRDPAEEVQGGANLYAFNLNDAINNQDLLGLLVHSVDITAKSWIAKPIIPGVVPNGNENNLLGAVGVVTDLTYDRVVDDSIDGKYRFLSRKVISIDCDGSTIKSVNFAPLFTDVGTEGGFMIPPDAIVVNDTGTHSGNAVSFSWMVKARPKPFSEPLTFTPVRNRNGHVYIWHKIEGFITVDDCGEPSVSVFLSSSQFPSAAVFYTVDGAGLVKAATYSQKAMARLWDPSATDPTLVK